MQSASTEAWTGGCACGAIRYEASSGPLAAGHCQCRQCQRESGTGHASHMVFLAAALHLKGEPRFYTQGADSGNLMSRGFCATCGSPLLVRSSGKPELVFVCAASLDDPARFKPQLVVYTAEGPAWDRLDPALPAYSRMPPPHEMPI
jgi:hypothetical protein